MDYSNHGVNHWLTAEVSVPSKSDAYLAAAPCTLHLKRRVAGVSGAVCRQNVHAHMASRAQGQALHLAAHRRGAGDDAKNGAAVAPTRGVRRTGVLSQERNGTARTVNVTFCGPGCPRGARDSCWVTPNRNRVAHSAQRPAEATRRRDTAQT